MTKSRGFTLVEMIIVMVIMGIIASVVSVFITGPVTGYVDANRRAQLSDAADIALRRLSRDLRLALPNSVRVGGGNSLLEYIPTTGGGRYLAASPNFLNFTIADGSFDYLGDSIAGVRGFVVVFNTGQRSATNCATAPGGADAYEGCNRTVISALIPPTATTVTMSAIKFPFTSPGNRFHVVPSTGPVTLACEGVGTSGGDGTGTLTIYSNYNTGSGDWGNAASITAPRGTGNLLGRYVSDCSFIYTPGVTATNGLVTLRLALTRSNETVTLHHQVHVDNAP